MALLLRNPVIVFAMLAACVGTVSVFTFAKPDYRRQVQSGSTAERHSVTEVRGAFAAHGIRLPHSTDAYGVKVLTTAVPFDADALQVAVAPEGAAGSWGPDVERYDERFDNVLVTYGGKDEALVQRIEAAVDDLR